MRVNTRYLNSTRGTSSKKRCLPVAYIHYISVTLGDTGAHRHKTEPNFIQDRTQSFDLETGSTYKHTNTHIYMLETDECGLHEFVYAHSAIYHSMWQMQSTHQQGTNIKKEPSAVAFKT